MESYLQSMENSYKNKTYFLQVVFQKNNFRKQSLSHTVHNSYKYYFLLTKENKFLLFAHLAFLTINSLTSSPPFVFSLFSQPYYHPLWPLLFPQISLSICISSLFSPYFFSPLEHHSLIRFLFFFSSQIDQRFYNNFWYIYQTITRLVGQ